MAKVLHGIEAAHEVGLGPIKINMVVKRGQNDQDIVPMARHFKGSPYILRFIKFMDVDASNGWKMEEVVPSAEVISWWRDRRDLQCPFRPSAISLHAAASLDGSQAVHLPVCDRRS